MVNTTKDFLITPSNPLWMHLKTVSKGEIQKKAEATGDLIGNKIADRITKAAKLLPQNNSETVTNEHDKEISEERYISLEERQKITDDLRLI